MQNLPIVVPSYRWTDNDIAYGELGDYISENTQHATRNTQIIYPYRSLFTKRSVDEREFEVKETSDALTISSTTVPDAIPFIVNKNQALVFDSEKEGVLDPKNTAACYPFKNGTLKATMENGYLRLEATDNRLCLNFGMTELWHRDGYLVRVTSRHVDGRPLTFSLINKTAKHTEIETQLSALSSQLSDGWQTDYFVLPPLSPDGKGYDVYIANDAIGRQTSMNDIADVKVYTIPYEEMIRETVRPAALEDDKTVKLEAAIQIENVEHPNPSYYKVRIQPSFAKASEGDVTLILSQSYDKGWKAYGIQSCQSSAPTGSGSAISCQIKNKIQELFPFIFGKEINPPAGGHVMVNNWENGWLLESTNLQINKSTNQCNNVTIEQCNNLTIVLFFLPQLWQWLGFILLPIPFLFLSERSMP